MIGNSWRMLVSLVASFLIASTVWAQDDDPFGGGAAADDTKPKPAARPASTEPPPPPTPDEPVIAQLRDSNPKTLSQVTRALRIALEVGDLEEFKSYGEQWLELKPSDADLFALSHKYGADFFIELVRAKDLQPEGEQIGMAVLDGAAKYTRDPARLRDLITKLSGRDTAAGALRGLREAGDAGVIALIAALADDTFKADRAAVRGALVALRRESIEPAIAALSAPLPETRADAAMVLGRLRTDVAQTYLIGLAAGEDDTPDRVAAREALSSIGMKSPTPSQASRFLDARIRQLLAGELPGKLDENDEVALWRWDDMAQTARRDRYPKDQAGLVVANRLAKQLVSLSQDPAQLRLALLTQLEADQAFAGLDQPLPQGKGTAWEVAKSLGIDLTLGALVDAIEMDRPTAIAALLEVLGASGRSEVLTVSPESPVVRALGYPDRRVQIAALKAILALDPAETFAGSSRVVETMKYLLASTGQSRVLVGHPRLDESSRIGALYSELGYEFDRASTGRALVRQAVASPDYELILISETIDSPTVQETVQILRKDPRTARIPIGVLEHFVVLEPRYIPDDLPEPRVSPLRKKGQEDAKDISDKKEPPTQAEKVARLLADERIAPVRLPGDAAEKAARLVKGAVVVPAPQSPEALRYAHDQIMRLSAGRVVPPEMRMEQAYFVLEQLGELLSRKQPPAFYEFAQLETAVIDASREEALTAQAAQVLGLLGTPKAQLALVEQASLPQNAPEDRQAAATAFAEAVQRRGLYLTQAQIQSQYDKLERTSEPELKATLQEILNTIEAPTAKVREEQRKLMKM